MGNIIQLLLVYNLYFQIYNKKKKSRQQNIKSLGDFLVYLLSFKGAYMHTQLIIIYCSCELNFYVYKLFTGIKGFQVVNM